MMLVFAIAGKRFRWMKNRGDEEMKKMSAFSTLERLSLAICATLLFFPVAAQAEPHLTMTSHVDRAVIDGEARVVGHLPGTQHLSLAISLPLRNESGLHDLLQQIYDPQSTIFRQYLSVQEFTERFGPAQDDYDAVVRFARANGLNIVDAASNRLVLDVEGSAQNIENAFHLALNLYQHPTENRTFYSPDREPSVDLDIPILHVSGLDNFTLPQSHMMRTAPKGGVTSKATGSGPGGQFIGSDMRAAYYGSGPLTGKGQSVGLFEYAGYEISDVRLFFKTVKQTLKVPVRGVSLNGVSLNCPPASCDDGEQVLDIEMAISMAPALKQVVVYVGSNDVSILNRMATDNTSKQLSCSWGWADDETSIDPILMAFAAQGQALFVATGDNGSASAASYVWPSDDPLVVAVGGTDITTNGAGGSWKSETGWSGSAGMPSKNKVPIPAYQRLPGVVTSTNHASRKLRNIPDVGAEANTNQFSCYDRGCAGGNGGTSYAAPVWAGFLALVNQQAVAMGKSPVGFINPAIYSIGTGTSYSRDFHDSKSGSNGGYSAVRGYDLVTGWGSPNGAALIDGLVGASN
jgi:subtilase family serine protease